MYLRLTILLKIIYRKKKSFQTYIFNVWLSKNDFKLRIVVMLLTSDKDYSVV